MNVSKRVSIKETGRLSLYGDKTDRFLEADLLPQSRITLSLVSVGRSEDDDVSIYTPRRCLMAIRLNGLSFVWSSGHFEPIHRVQRWVACDYAPTATTTTNT